ncbi:hypothetical protein QOT17_010250 [Balamuthia mandrillaris]
MGRKVCKLVAIQLQHFPLSWSSFSLCTAFAMVTLWDTPPLSPSRARPHCLVLLPRSLPFYQASFKCSTWCHCQSSPSRRLHHNVIYSEDTEIALIVDGSHQPILKPSDKNTRCGYWSGKEQDFTILILAFITPTGWVSSLSGSFPGSIGDKGIWNVLGDDGPWNALESWGAICGDKGFVGIEHDHRAVVCKKAPKNGTLSEADIMENSYVSSLRVRVENTFARMKQWKACRQRRMNLASHQQMWNVIASLVNLAWLGWDLSNWESGEDGLFFLHNTS